MDEVAHCALSWVHFGDLHTTTAGAQNYRDFRALVEQVDTHLRGHVDFCLLPGDNADNGTPSQYRLVQQALADLHIPIHILPGDHDYEQGSLDAFYSGLGGTRLPYGLSIGGCRCLFLDIISPGGGGPDFRLGAEQLAWLEQQLIAAREAAECSVIFMHAYPADLKADGDTLLRLMREYGVKAIDMGHTHYNELANDGRRIYATTRSTGQIEEGPVGFSVMALENGALSWRFKPLHSGWPFILITAPADQRLITDPLSPDQVVSGRFTVSARAWSAAGIKACRCRIDDGPWRSMSGGSTGSIWQLACDSPRQNFVLTVETEDGTGAIDTDSIRVAVTGYRREEARADGSDADTIGAWPERHLLATRLGPNRNGRHW